MEAPGAEVEQVLSRDVGRGEGIVVGGVGGAWIGVRGPRGGVDAQREGGAMRPGRVRGGEGAGGGGREEARGGGGGWREREVVWRGGRAGGGGGCSRRGEGRFEGGGEEGVDGCWWGGGGCCVGGAGTRVCEGGEHRCVGVERWKGVVSSCGWRY